MVTPLSLLFTPSVSKMDKVELRLTIPLYTSRVSAGFPSPAEDHLDSRLDLNRWLIDHPAATFCVRVEGDSMTSAHIYDGDVLVVDRMVEADDGDIIVARVGCEMCVKRLRVIEGGYQTDCVNGNNQLNLIGVAPQVSVVMYTTA